MAQILNMLLLFPLFSILLLIDCRNQVVDHKSTSQIHLSTIEDLLLFAYNSRNGSIFHDICIGLNDSIANGKLAWYQKKLEINEVTKEINWIFIREEYPIPSVHHRLLFEICIEGGDSISIKCDKTSINDLRILAEEFIFNPDSLEKKIVIRKSKFAHFGEIDVSRATAVLSADLTGKSGLSVEEWKMLFNCIHEMILLTEKKRNELSWEKWNQDYASLSFEKQVVLSTIVGSRVTLIFNSPCCQEITR
jgi:hypothetical protein